MSFDDFQNHEQKGRKLKIGFWEYSKINLAKWFKCIKMSYVQRLFIKAQKKALEEMDFFMILRRLQEVEKLKLILLNPEQVKLFNLLSKPMIFDEKEMSEDTKREDGYKMSMLIDNSKKISQGKGMHEVLDYYHNAKVKKGSKVDQRLIALVEESMKCFSTNYRTSIQI